MRPNENGLTPLRYRWPHNRYADVLARRDERSKQAASTRAVKKIPDGYSTSPYYVVSGRSEFIDFLKKAFGAEELVRMPLPGGKLGHAEVRIGSSMVMLADQSAEHPATSMNGALYVQDCDAAFKRALEAGAKQPLPLENKFYGYRSGTVKDKWGNTWTIGTHVEDVPPEEMERRMKAMKPS